MNDANMEILAKIKIQIKEQLKSMASTPPSLRFQAALENISEADLNQLIQSIDASEYPLSDWILTLQAFFAWEDKEHRVVPLSHKIEYIHCCVEGAGPGRLQPLLAVWADYVKTYGVE